MKNSNDTIGNRTRDLTTCRAVPQPTAPPRAPGTRSISNKKRRHILSLCSSSSVRSTHMFIYLFNNVVSKVYKQSIHMMTVNQELERLCNLTYNPSTCLKGLSKATKGFRLVGVSIKILLIVGLFIYGAAVRSLHVSVLD
jgi:hypothetical protein